MGESHVYNVYKDGEMIAEGVTPKEASELTGIPARNVWSYTSSYAAYMGRFRFRLADGGTEEHTERDAEMAFVRKFGRQAFEQVKEMNRRYGS